MPWTVSTRKRPGTRPCAWNRWRGKRRRPRPSRASHAPAASMRNRPGRGPDDPGSSIHTSAGLFRPYLRRGLPQETLRPPHEKRPSRCGAAFSRWCRVRLLAPVEFFLPCFELVPFACGSQFGLLGPGGGIMGGELRASLIEDVLQLFDRGGCQFSEAVDASLVESLGDLRADAFHLAQVISGLGRGRGLGGLHDSFSTAVEVHAIGDHAHVALVVALAAELHRAVHQGVEGVIHANAYVGTGVMAGSALADDDIAGHSCAASVDLNAQALCARFATVIGTTCSFLVCH